MKKSIRDAYGEALLELGRENSEVVVLDADVSGSTKSITFGKEIPERFFNVGVAEANMAGMAAGFAATGYIPFINTFAAFMVLRAGDPIRSLIGYGKLNVKVAGAYAGMSDSYDGATHHTLMDIAFFRALQNFTVVSAADAVQAKAATKAAAFHNGPVYLRLSRAEVPVIYGEDYTFELGKGEVLREGNDVTLVATGVMVQKALEAHELLKEKGISARVVNIHTIKPIDKDLLTKCAKETGAIVTAEEHNIYGGLGGAVSEALAESCPVPIAIVGVKDVFAESGDYEQLLEKYGLAAKNILDEACKVIKRK
ncbi:MAG: transketolase [Clostridia bacterium]|jgi:transketolase|nr:transketolase [Clostridia bacterium]